MKKIRISQHTDGKVSYRSEAYQSGEFSLKILESNFKQQPRKLLFPHRYQISFETIWTDIRT